MFHLADSPAAVAGRAVSLTDAIAAAAALLGRARAPVIAGLRTDAAGAAAAVSLARRLDAVVDHAESESLLRNLDAMRTAGAIIASPMVARAEADFVLFVGEVGAEAASVVPDRAPTLDPARPRRIERITGEDLTARLGLLRALVKRRGVTAPAELAALAAALRDAHYAVIVWSAATLSALAVEMLCGLIDDLNAATRCAGVPLAAPGNAAGVVQAIGAATGFPCRVAFHNGVPRHDAFQYDAARLVESGAADAALWLDALGEGPAPWRRAVKLVALAPPDTTFAAAPDVTFAVGRPGIDHDAVLHHPLAGALLAQPASTPRDLPAAADLLGRIADALPC